MIVKKQIPLAGPRDKSCGNCRWGDPKLHVCCAKDTVLTDEDLAFYSCSDWKEKSEIDSTTEISGDKALQGAPVPLQPDGSIKFRTRETIGAETVNTDAVVRLQTLCDEAEPCKAKVTFQYEKQPVFGGTSLKELEEKQKSSGWDHRLEAKALDRGAKQGMTLEALDTVFAIACQQVPSMEKRWMELRAEINVMFAQKWAAEDMPK